MILRLKVVRGVIFVLILFCLTCNYNREKGNTYKQIKNYINTIKIVNTHEHQRSSSEIETVKPNFYYLLFRSYLKADLSSAGADFIERKEINSYTLDELWDMYGKYLNFCRGTSYYSHFIKGFQTLYDFNDSYFTKKNIQSLSEQIADNYKDYKLWFGEAFNKAGFEIMLIDRYWNRLNTKIDTQYFALVFNIKQLVSEISERPHKFKKDTPVKSAFYKLAAKKRKIIKTLDDYLAFADILLKEFIDKNTVCLKNSMAYSRTIDYEYIPYKKAKILFKKNSSKLTAAEKKNLQDFMFHWIIQKSIEYDLPIQIHTGYLAGNGNTLENSRPIKLNKLFIRYPDAKFILFHGGYPWTGEYIALGKMFRNVYLDIVWLPQISREAAVHALDEMFDCVPYNKFFWGGDCALIEESTGSLEFGKDIVAQVLAKRIKRGLLTKETAFDIAQRIFRDNAIFVFKLNDRLNKKL
jgi:hypothetical protein